MNDKYPTPWTIIERNGCIEDARGDLVVFLPANDQPDLLRGKTIIRAVNAHADLVAALERAIEMIRAWNGLGMDHIAETKMWELYQSSPEMKQINTALAKAKGEK